MRDIRGDLQDRASFLKEQLSAAQAQFEKRQDQLNQEHQARIEDLQSELEAVTTLMEREYQRLSNAPAQDERPVQAPPERHPGPEAAPDRRSVPEAEYRRHQEQEPYRSGPEAEPQHRQAREPEQYRRPRAVETAPQRRPAPVPIRERVQERAHEDEGEQRPAAPQVYRRAPLTSAREDEREQRRPAERTAQAPQQPPLADFLIRKLSELGAMTFEDLCHLADQEGYFAEGDVDRGVHITLTNVVKAGFIRQQPDGTFAPATVMDTIRLRRAI